MNIYHGCCAQLFNKGPEVECCAGCCSCTGKSCYYKIAERYGVFEEPPEKCVFCEITKRAQVDVIDIEPLNPVVPGHRIVFSSRHSKDFTDSDITLTQVMLHAAKVARQNGMQHYNLITSKGEFATQSIFHLHVHLVPRHENDGLALPWTKK